MTRTDYAATISVVSAQAGTQRRLMHIGDR
ncbi:MAG: hypothetical protein GAK35_03000 [Herbaspirillum frisingense]|uniref:Uncharacterized protein n=1 Tax=Herbaspirillum frisingense TaxID=92645 RepID=A0A7V8FV26_9BURK|nr:MAG: hypothetical protein GAK35_03000 [Herbaspirillum frisingense]